MERQDINFLKNVPSFVPFLVVLESKGHRCPVGRYYEEGSSPQSPPNGGILSLERPALLHRKLAKVELLGGPFSETI